MLNIKNTSAPKLIKNCIIYSFNSTELLNVINCLTCIYLIDERLTSKYATPYKSPNTTVSPIVFDTPKLPEMIPFLFI